MTPTSHAAQAGINLDSIDANPLAPALKLALGSLGLYDFDEAARIGALARNAACAAQDAPEYFDRSHVARVYNIARMCNHDIPDEALNEMRDVLISSLAQRAVMCQPPAPTCQAAGAICQPAAQADNVALSAAERTTILAWVKEYRQKRFLTPAEQTLVRKLESASPAPETAQADDWIGAVVRDVAELPDRDSPPDAPDMMLVTSDELREIVERHAPAAHAQQDVEPDGEICKHCGSIRPYHELNCVVVGARIPDSVPSAATGKADADNAGGLTREALMDIEPNVEGALFGGEKRAFENGFYMARNTIISMLDDDQSPVTSAAVAKHAELADEQIIEMAQEHGVESREFPNEFTINLVRAAIAASQKGTEA